MRALREEPRHGDANDGCPDEDKATVRISVDASQAALMDIFGFFEGKMLRAEVTMRKEDACDV